MTSLQLLPGVDHKPTVPKEWGTGKDKEHVDLWIPTAPTWHCKGEPTDQYYTLTQLKLSNIRSNDQLLPKPQESQMGRILINRPFPAEHPYSSHTSRLAVFPTFDSPEDPKRGVDARRQQPINSEMPAHPYDVTIVHKTKGFGNRHEIQALPKESEKRALEWLGEDGFHQQVKVHGGRPQFYPVPPRTVIPNLQKRPPEMTVSERTANSLRNIEKNQWQTTYDLEHTGLGPSNPMKLDDLNEKTFEMNTYGFQDDRLYPRSVNTFDPPRPFEGRIARHLIPKPQPQRTDTIEDDTGYIRKMTMSELEEHRLLNGRDYLNLPEGTIMKGTRWRDLEETAHPEKNMETLEEAREEQPTEEAPYLPAGAPPDTDEGKYLQEMKDRRDQEIQDIEAQNRWNVLEAHKPHHDLNSLNYKYDYVLEREKPPTFYNHEGKYNEERAGLYKTSYSPERLAHSMNRLETSGPEIMNTLHSHVNALQLPTRLSSDMRDAFRYSRTLNFNTPNLSGDRRSSHEVLEPFRDLKQDHKKQLQPTAETARMRVQEGETILKESTMGESYNVPKFLQENDLQRHPRIDPLHVMSNENKQLSNVRMMSSMKPQKSVSFSDNVTVATTTGNGPLRFGSAPTRLTDDEKRELAQVAKERISVPHYTSTHALWRKENENVENPKAVPRVTVYTVATKKEETHPIEAQSPRLSPRRPATSAGTEYRDEFNSMSTNFAPTNLKNSMQFQTAYQSQFPTFMIDYKDDPRFRWQPGHGEPRPQTSLLKIQDSFSKSNIRNRFHSQFRESNPDLRSNIIKGKKHTFYGMNAQSLHG